MMNTIIPLFQKIDCVRLHVADLDEALAFYRDRLGHELVWRTDRVAGLRMPDTDAEIVLLDFSKGLLVTDEAGNIIGNAEP